METKTLIYKDEKRLKEIYEMAGNAEKALNAFIEKAETVFKTEFSHDDRISLKDNGAEFMRNWIKQKYPFPEADDDFNQKALGIDIAPLVKLPRTWQAYNFKLNEMGLFELDGEPEQAKRYFYYADTPKKTKALAMAKKLSKLINEASELGFLENRLLYQAREMGDILTTEQVKVKDRANTHHTRIVPNVQRIARMD